MGVAAGHENYKWWALSCTSLGMLLAATNSGTLIIALPDLERSLHTSLLSLVWVILAYLIAATVLVLSAGRLSDLFGRKRAYVGGFLAFALASLGAGFASGPTALIEYGGLRLLTDPTFDPPGEHPRPGTPVVLRKLAGPAVPAEELEPVDAVLLSHDHHADNLDPAGRALLPRVGRVLTTGAGADPAVVSASARRLVAVVARVSSQSATSSGEYFASG